MSNTVGCPHCSQPMQYVQQLQGQQVLCPHCQQQFMMPPPARPSAPQATPAQPVQGQPVQGQPVQGQPVQGQPVQGFPVQGQPVNPFTSPAGGASQSTERKLTREQLQRVKTPAMIMLIMAILGIALSSLSILGNGYSIATGPSHYDTYFYGQNWWARFAFGIFTASVNVILSFIVMDGAQKMMKGREYGSAKTAAIISCIPCCIFPILAMPFGIWSLVVLSDDDIRRNFRSRRRRR